MEEIKSFVLRNWKEISAVILFVIATIIGFVSKKKKGYSFSDILLGLLAEQLPNMINSAETCFGAGNGEQKKVKVLNDALNYCAKTLGRKLSEEETQFIISNASKQIENILGTPQKKEDPKENKPTKKSKYR